MRLYRITVSTYEPEGAGTDFPILTHVFMGRTPQEAWGYVASHRGTDAFMRACLDDGRWNQVECPSRVVEGWVNIKTGGVSR